MGRTEVRSESHNCEGGVRPLSAWVRKPPRAAVAVLVLFLSAASVAAHAQNVYGPLGAPESNAAAWDGVDPAPAALSARSRIELFRQNQLRPLQGTDDNPVRWAELDERGAYQRALYYSVLESDPGLITDQDRLWLKEDDANLLHSQCENQESIEILFKLDLAACAGQ